MPTLRHVYLQATFLGHKPEEGGIVRGLSYEDEIPNWVLRDAIRAGGHMTYEPTKTALTKRPFFTSSTNPPCI